ncbi:hypothetical protein X739_32370 [Mesorhizobium sp. LNHC220B00]|uniref:poly-gamma-glutamate hydrolase family protein n=1 Tax=Mesorhizobium sp. M0496 TaxID=2956952 RepID=UPI0003CF2728|nr:hypothetical protein X739_32370 [Mesorhizobium sp. LNHC220B00]
MTKPKPGDTYASFADLAAHEQAGSDYDISLSTETLAWRVAPHGGRIEYGI